MKIMDTTFARSTYEVTVAGSILYEAAMGIAAITYPEIHHSLERDRPHWDKVQAGLSEDLKKELDYARKHNTWKVLLDLIDESGCSEKEDFQAYVRSLEVDELKERAFPYLGAALEMKIGPAVRGDRDAVQDLLNAVEGHLFFPGLVKFLSEVDGEMLREHVMKLVDRWCEEVMAKDPQAINEIIMRDMDSKRAMLEKLDPEAFVSWVLGGEGYRPEPAVTKVLLVPQISYRPWVIQAERPDTKVFFYPVADESLSETEDVYKPPFLLVQKYKALGDETRLRMVKLLSEQNRTLKELTEILGMGKTTVHHHLRLLRSAKIVRAEGKGFTLSSDFPGTESSELDIYLGRER
jgi:biotin operon repressor